MSDSIATTVFSATIGWVISQGRTIAGRNLRHGDVFNQLLCSLVTRELDDIKSKLDASAQKDLGAAISSYKEGVNHLIAEENELDGPGPAKRIKLEDRNDFFEVARKQASLAFHNASLSPEKRILATYIRVMARLREKRNDPEGALISCRLYLEEMHAMEEVKSNLCLKLHGSPVKKQLRRFTNAEERLNSIILSVYHVNRILFGITQMIGEGKHTFVWPSVKCKCGRNEVDPLRDPKFRKIVRQQSVDMDVMRTFGQGDEEAGRRLKSPCGIATNSQDEYLVVDSTDTKVFDSSGKYLYSFSRLLGDRKYHTVDIDTDQNGRVYLLACMVNKSHTEDCYEVFVFDMDRSNTFELRNKSKGRKISVSQPHRDTETKVLVLEGKKGFHAMVEVYETDGTFVCQFGERVLQDAQDIVGANNGHVYVLDKCHESKKKFIREFGARRDQLRRFDVAYESVAIAFHPPSQHIVVISTSSSKELELSVYNIKEQLVHSRKVPNSDGRERVAQNVTVTIKGRIVVVAVVIGMNSDDEERGEIIVY